MRQALCILIGSAALLSGCKQSSGNEAANEAAANSAAPAKKPAYCFFKREEMKGWTASRDKDGNIVVKGKAHVKDPRYKAVLGEPAIEGKSAVLSPTIGQNDTGYATADDWWDVTATVPKSTSVSEAKVECGGNTLADLQVPPKS